MRASGRVPIRLEILGVPGHVAAGARLAPRLDAVVGALAPRATGARLRFADDNGPKGGVAIRCALTVKTPGRPPVHVEDTATTVRLAFDGALAKLERRLARERIVRRESERRPKKYFLAARELARG